MRNFIEKATTVLESILFLTAITGIGLVWYSIHQVIVVLKQSPMFQLIMN